MGILSRLRALAHWADPWNWEPPAKAYSLRTVTVGFLSVVFVVLAMVSGILGWHWIVIAVLGVVGVTAFVIAKGFERRDRGRYGADHDSWMNKIGP